MIPRTEGRSPPQLSPHSYTPLIALVPKQVDEKKQEKKFHSVEEYENLSDIEWKRLTLEEIDFIETKRMKDGKMPRINKWGSYDAELLELEGMIKRSPTDFDYLRRMITHTLTDAKKMEEDRQMMIAMESMQDQFVNIEEQKKEMGQWIARYFEDAGYSTWHTFPQFYKVMLMNAFPPVDPLDGDPIDWKTADIEKLYMGFLRVADGHVAQQRKGMKGANKVHLGTLLFKK